jgi:hypothetical protein
MHATQLWRLWQELLQPFRPHFTAPGFRRFVQWLTGLVLNVEEHTVTQSLLALGQTDHWMALESFVEYGAWDREGLEACVSGLLHQDPGALWYGYHVWAADDSKTHRTSQHVWGTCTFHEYSARCPNRAGTVRAHNWLVLGALLRRPDQPACFAPVAGRLYFRQSQLPAGEAFRTKCELLVDLARQQAKTVPGEHLAVFDGAFAVRSVVRRLARPQEPGAPSVEFLTRLRGDAVLYRRPVQQPGQRGRRRVWGERLPPPRQGGRWSGPWQQGQAWVYGRLRPVRWKEVVCLWGVLGWERPVKVVVAEVEGYRKRFTLVSSARELSGLQLLELFCARFRQEDGFRDLKQRLGWEECRAWTKEPILRTTQAQLLVLTLLRLLQVRLEQQAGTQWWFQPPWNPHKSRPSVLDLGRLWWQHREAIQRLLSDWWDQEEKGAAARSAERPAA